jgi:hypothetical protein
MTCGLFELKIFPEAGKIYFLYDSINRLCRDLRGFDRITGWKRINILKFKIMKIL